MREVKVICILIFLWYKFWSRSEIHIRFRDIKTWKWERYKDLKDRKTWKIEGNEMKVREISHL